MLLTKFLKLSPSLASTIILIFFSIFPDIDINNSEIGFIFRPISYELEEHFGHRSITHSFLFLGISSLLFFILFPDYVIYVIIALFSHVFLDMLTYTGTKLLWPLNYRFVIFDGPVITGSSLDYLIAISSWMIYFLI